MAEVSPRPALQFAGIHPNVTPGLDPIPLIIPYGGISLLAGAPGAGKTTLLAGLFRAFRDGLRIFGHQPNPLSSIAVLSVDRSWSSTKEWFARAGFPDIPYYSLADDPDFVKSRLRRKYDRINILGELLAKLPLKPGGLVAVDPLGMFLGGNLIDYDGCATACLEIRDLLRKRQLTMIGTAHAAKQRGSQQDRYVRLQDRILGSAAIYGFSDTQMYLASPQELEVAHYTFLWNPHLLPAETFHLTRNAEGLFVPFDSTDGGNLERLCVLLPEDGASWTFDQILQAARAIPLTRATVRRIVNKLIDEGRVRKVGHGLYARASVS